MSLLFSPLALLPSSRSYSCHLYQGSETLYLFIERADEQDSQVEIDAKIAAGYFGGAKDVKAEDLHLTVGRAWEDLEH